MIYEAAKNQKTETCEILFCGWEAFERSNVITQMLEIFSWRELRIILTSQTHWWKKRLTEERFSRIDKRSLCLLVLIHVKRINPFQIGNWLKNCLMRLDIICRNKKISLEQCVIFLSMKSDELFSFYWCFFWFSVEKFQNVWFNIDIHVNWRDFSHTSIKWEEIWTKQASLTFYQGILCFLEFL